MENGFVFYFGLADADEFGDADELFEHKGKYYFYKIEGDREMFTIEDTCNRMVPFDCTSIKELNLAMFGATRYYNAQDDAEQLVINRARETQSLMDFWNDA